MERSKQRFQKFLIFVLLWLLTEGAVRKWLFPGLTDVLYFVKYLLAIMVLVQLRQFKKVKTSYSDIKTPISVFVLFCLLSLFYTAIINSPLVGILGIISYLCFIPLAMAIPIVLDSEEKIKKVLVFLVLISIIVSILGIIQYNSPQDAFINKYATNEESDIATAGEVGKEVVRVSTLFSYHSGNATYALFVFIFILVLLFENQKSILVRGLIYFAFGLCVINLFMTGSRTVVFQAVFIAAIFVLSKSIYILSNTKIIMGFVLMTSILAITVLYTDAGTKAFSTWNMRYEAGNENNEYVSRTSVLMDEVNGILFDLPGGIMGYGIGTYQNGASRFNQIKGLPGAEDQAHRIGLELGPMGFIVWFLTTAAIAFYTYKVFVYTKTPFLKNLALALALYAFWGPALYRQIVVSWLDNACWWIGLGLIVSIKQIEVNKRSKALEKDKVNELVVTNG